MGQLTIKVPDVGEGIAEVELVSWSVAEGQPVTRNQIVAEVMTDKATVEVPAPVDGVVGALTGGVGDVLLVGSPLFTLEVEGAGDPNTTQTEPDGAASTTPEPPRPPANAAIIERAMAASSESGATAGAVAHSEAPAPSAPAPTVQPSAPGVQPPAPQHRALKPAPSDGGARQASAFQGNGGAPRPEGRRPTATPAVRRRARDGGIDLRTVTGTGPAGRITHQDLDEVFHNAGDSRQGGTGSARISGVRPPDDQVDDQPIVGMRRKIAQQMISSVSTIPHITYVDEVDMTALEELRAGLNEHRADGQPKLTLLPFLVRALVNHLPDFPQMNAHVLDADDQGGADGSGGSSSTSTLRTFGGVHVGIAAQTDAGLVVPVLRHAESETIWSAAQRIGELADAARNGTAGRDDLTGSTITISSLGSLGGLVTTPVINKPETTIIGVNKMTTAPVWVDGAFVPRKMMNLSSSFDHRVIDGWDAARFVQAIKRSLEQPALLFVDQT